MLCAASPAETNVGKGRGSPTGLSARCLSFKPVRSRHNRSRTRFSSRSTEVSSSRLRFQVTWTPATNHHQRRGAKVARGERCGQWLVSAKCLGVANFGDPPASNSIDECERTQQRKPQFLEKQTWHVGNDDATTKILWRNNEWFQENHVGRLGFQRPNEATKRECGANRNKL